MLVWDRDQDVPPEVRIACESDQDVGHPCWGSATRWRHTRDNQATTVVPIERSLDVGGRKAGGDVSFGGVVDLSDISDGRTHAFLWVRHGTRLRQ